MSSDLRAAAKRILSAAYDVSDIYDLARAVAPDAEALARHYIATTRPDDGEEWDGEWLSALLGPELKADLGGGFEIQFYESIPPTLSVSHGGFRDYYSCNHEFDPPQCDTRGNVRRLCAALGVELREGE